MGGSRKGQEPELNHGLLSGPELAAGLGHNLTANDMPHPRQRVLSPQYFCSSLDKGSSASPEAKEAGKPEPEKNFLFPHNAKYLIDHVLYLPVHKRVPLWYLQKVCNAVEKVMKDRVGVKLQRDKTFVLFPSKL